MPLWTFRQYVTELNQWPFRDWLYAQDPHVQQDLYFWIRHLEQSQKWRSKRAQELTDEHAGLWEIRFRSDDRAPNGKVIRKRRIRPVGVRVKERREFILFGAGEELGHGRYEPDGAFDDALRRMHDFKAGRGTLHDFD